MLYQEIKEVNGQPVITESTVINQSKLTDECWLIQFSGIAACSDCEALNTPDCGGQAIRKKLKELRK